LNQRGGRTLGIVDLIEANTLDAPLAAYLWEKIDAGCSFLTAARPGGAGKSTVLANMLNFLPAGTAIRTVASVRDLPNPPASDTCYLAHEIGSGPYFAYLWGAEARRFLELPATFGPESFRVASCLHADTPDELRSILTAPPNSLSDEAVLSIGLIVFVRIEMAGGIRRRVGSVYERHGTRHRLAYEWDASADIFLSRNGVTPSPDRTATIRALQDGGVRDFRETRRLLTG